MAFIFTFYLPSNKILSAFKYLNIFCYNIFLKKRVFIPVGNKRSGIPGNIKLIILFSLILVCLILALILRHLIFDESDIVKSAFIVTLIVLSAILISLLLIIAFTFKNVYSTIYIKGRQLEHCFNELEKIKKYDTQKTEFFTNISHELKTPLSVILGAIQLLEQNNSITTIERRKSGKNLQIIKQNSYRLLRLINNFLDISRIDSGYAKLCMTNCNMVQLIKEISASVEPYAELKHLNLEFISETDELIAAVDIDKIERVILNLLSNAIKFTPTGGNITISVQEENNKNVIISVKDTGVGVPKNLSEKIFERFGQVGNSFTREHEGTGIGLYLVKSFVDLHDGSIELDSKENSGSEFTITLPIRNASTPSECTGSVNNKEQKRVIETINIELSDIYSAVS